MSRGDLDKLLQQLAANSGDLAGDETLPVNEAAPVATLPDDPRDMAHYLLILKKAN